MCRFNRSSPTERTSQAKSRVSRSPRDAPLQRQGRISEVSARGGLPLVTRSHFFNQRCRGRISCHAREQAGEPTEGQPKAIAKMGALAWSPGVRGGLCLKAGRSLPKRCFLARASVPSRAPHLAFLTAPTTLRATGENAPIPRYSVMNKEREPPSAGASLCQRLERSSRGSGAPQASPRPKNYTRDGILCPVRVCRLLGEETLSVASSFVSAAPDSSRRSSTPLRLLTSSPHSTASMDSL